jgi:hypothetical protein
VTAAAAELEAAPFPYTAWTKVADVAPGAFSSRVRPDRNTRYRLVANGVTSKARTVFVRPAANTHRRRIGHHRYRVSLVLVGPPDLPYAGRRVYFYRSGRRVAVSRLKARRPGVVRAAATLRLPKPGTRVVACIHKRSPDAWGRPRAIDRRCGAARLSGSSRPAGRPARPSP